MGNEATIPSTVTCLASSQKVGFPIQQDAGLAEMYRLSFQPIQVPKLSEKQCRSAKRHPARSFTVIDLITLEEHLHDNENGD